MEEKDEKFETMFLSRGSKETNQIHWTLTLLQETIYVEKEHANVT